MAFNFFESSRSRSKPYHLYLVRYGAGPSEYYAFTDNEVDVTLSGVQYLSRQISHGDISTNGSMDRAAVDVTAPKTNELFELFRVYPPSYRVRLTIMRGHHGDPDGEVKTIWSGRIISMTVRGPECTFTCEPISTTMKRLGLRRNWQYGCPHSLYGPQCKANKNAVKRTPVITSVGAGWVGLPVGWNGSVPIEKYIGGIVEIPMTTSVSRTILRVEADRVLLAGSLTGMSVGVTVAVYPGCSHSMDDCKNVHGNLLNFGGMPWIPLDNPVGSKNNFY